MIDFASYRARIGLHNIKKCGGKKKKNKLGSNGLNTHLWKLIIILAVGTVCISLLCQTYLNTPNNCTFGSKNQLKLEITQCSDVGFKLLF